MRRIIIVFSITLIMAAAYQLFAAPYVEALEIDAQVLEVKEAIEIVSETSTTIPKELTIPEVKFPIDQIRTVDVTATEQEYLEASAIGLISVPESGIEASLRYGTQYASNLDTAACVTDFSSEDRLYILGHNYTNPARPNKMFHNLVETEVGEQVNVTLLVDGGIKEYHFEVVSSQWCSEEDYLADNASILTNNQEYDGEYELVLITCNHKSDCKGRQILLCTLIEE